MCVWEDRDLTYTDPAPLKSARWEYGSRWAGCLLVDTETTESIFYSFENQIRLLIFGKPYAMFVKMKTRLGGGGFPESEPFCPDVRGAGLHS